MRLKQTSESCSRQEILPLISSSSLSSQVLYFQIPSPHGAGNCNRDIFPPFHREWSFLPPPWKQSRLARGRLHTKADSVRRMISGLDWRTAQRRAATWLGCRLDSVTVWASENTATSGSQFLLYKRGSLLSFILHELLDLADLCDLSVQTTLQFLPGLLYRLDFNHHTQSWTRLHFCIPDPTQSNPIHKYLALNRTRKPCATVTNYFTSDL